MKRNRARRHASAADGFSLIELMISLVIVVIVFAIAMQAMVEMVQRKSVETNKMDLVQESREFMDQITNDIHQSGYPSYKMFDYASPTLIAQPFPYPQRMLALRTLPWARGKELTV